MTATEPSLAATMKHLNLTQDGVRVLLGVASGSVSQWLADERSMPEHIRRLLVVLDNGRNTAAVRAIDAYDPFGASVRHTRIRQAKVDKPLTNAQRQKRYRERQKQAHAAATA